MPAKVYVGIDSHSDFHKVAILPASIMEGLEEGDWEKRVKPKLKPLKLKNDRESYELFRETLSAAAEPSEIVIGMEYTGGHYTAPLCHFLSAQGYQLWFVEAKALKEFKEKFLGQSNKTDDVDSREMAFYLYARATLKRKLRVSTVKPELGTEAAVLKNIILQRWNIQRTINQSTNRLHQLLIASFPEAEEKYFTHLLKIITVYPSPRAIIEESNGLAEFKSMRKAVKADILKLAGESIGVPGKHYEQAIRTIALERQQMEEKVDELTRQMEETVKDHPYGKILLSFPNISTISAATLIAVIRDINRYPTDRKLQKTLGVAPGVKQSGQKNGKSNGKGKLMYEGSKDSRRAIYQIIFGSISPQAKPNDVRDLYQRLKAQGRPGTSAMMRCSVVLCEQIYFCLSNGVFYEYQGGKQCQSVSDISLPKSEPDSPVAGCVESGG